MPYNYMNYQNTPQFQNQQQMPNNYYQQPQMQAPMNPIPQQPQQRAPQTQSPPINGFVWVRDRAECSSYLVAPGESMLLMNSELPELYLVSRDASGKYNPTEVYALVRQDTQQRPIQTQAQPQPQQPVQQIDTSQFVTVSDVEKIVQSRIDKLLKKPNNQNNREKEV